MSHAASFRSQAKMPVGTTLNIKSESLGGSDPNPVRLNGDNSALAQYVFVTMYYLQANIRLFPGGDFNQTDNSGMGYSGIKKNFHVPVSLYKGSILS
jgi:hypothetical protein